MVIMNRDCDYNYYSLKFFCDYNCDYDYKNIVINYNQTVTTIVIDPRLLICQCEHQVSYACYCKNYLKAEEPHLGIYGTTLACRLM